MPLSPLPGPVVETDWLAARLDEPSVRILDATYVLPGTGRDPRAEFEAAHLPGSVFFDIDAVALPSDETGLPHMAPTAKIFAERVGALGVSDEDVVVAYDTYGLMSAARVWWLFRLFGHEQVAVLSGGLPKWRAEGRPLAAGPAAPRAATFRAALRPELVRDADAVQAIVEGGGAQILDARDRGRFEGTAPEIWPGRRSGHIPGSRNLPFGEILDPETKAVLPPDRLRALYERAGIDLDGPVVASCGSGVTAAALALGLAMIGRKDVAVYDGSWAEWGLDGPRPVETGPSRHAREAS